MHELAICESIVHAVREHAAGRPVRTVHLRIGNLRQVVPDTLIFCWSLVTDGSDLAEVELLVERIEGRIRCRQCHGERVLDDYVFACDRCGGVDVEVVAGEEFLITALELTEA
ncbi:hydrogenase maturation nickel metallochaperone HypA [Nocardia sp. alder85J]|uniref:hydrogenase maturation nickel metallochaperone HypA n=1 Tax=Nocardia sp. alder85J TaxID=2862949 RepID=UPI001CD74CC5|nr:hydrogenase maturation nickel metallochaperone HypA [Nocardia sp. alder85J]MCX4098097.1 hydrogenase maturation nickel metallochaperone HypA [Nocardia sp. alder85J]